MEPRVRIMAGVKVVKIWRRNGLLGTARVASYISGGSRCAGNHGSRSSIRPATHATPSSIRDASIRASRSFSNRSPTPISPRGYAGYWTISGSFATLPEGLGVDGMVGLCRSCISSSTLRPAGLPESRLTDLSRSGSSVPVPRSSRSRSPVPSFPYPGKAPLALV